MDMTPDNIMKVVTRVDGQRSTIAKYFKVAINDSNLDEMLRSMRMQGYLRWDASEAQYMPGRQLESQEEEMTVPLPARRYVEAGRPAPGSTGTARGQRPAPAGVPCFAQPAAAEPDEVTTNAERAQPVLDAGQERERAARNARVDMLELIHPLMLSCRSIREEYEEGTADSDDLLETLLKAVDDSMANVGYGAVGQLGETYRYDPELHQINGESPSQTVEQVIVTRPGVTWTDNGKTHIMDKASVDLYDEEWGQFSFHAASDLEGDEQSLPVWFDEDTPLKPATYEDEDFYCLVVAVRCSDENPHGCPQGNADCGDMIFFFSADDGLPEGLHVPAGLVFMTTVEE